jgi:tetratricopeptide (TPR) repeat protein
VAINKSNSPMWVKVTLIILIVAFVMSFVVLASNPFQAFAPTGTTPSGQKQDPIAQIDAQFQPQVAAITAQLQSDPASYTVLVSLGNTYFDYAIQKQQASQTSTAAAGSDLPLWSSAKDAYERALKIDATESAVRMDYAITLFYTGDSLAAIKIGEEVVKEDPTFAPGWFNSGVFYAALSQNAKAITAFEKYLALDPKGEKGGSPEFAKTQIKQLKASGGATPITTSTP